MGLRSAVGTVMRFVLGHQLTEQQKRLDRTDRVIAVMASARTHALRQTDKLRHSGRRGSSRLAHR